MVGTGATLAARHLLFPWIVLTNATHPTHSDRVQMWHTTDLLLPWFLDSKVRSGLPFPYARPEEWEPDF